MDNHFQNGYSFCIITDSKEPQKLTREVESIHARKIPNYEIHIVQDDTPPYGRTGALRNKACRMARFDHIVMLDDDIIFYEDFFQGLLEFGKNYEVFVPKIQNPDGSRFYDWKIMIDGKNYLLDYNLTDEKLSLSSTILVMKTWVFKKVQMDENLGYYEGEDVDYSDRLKLAGVRIVLNPYCTVTHDGPYKQAGQSVVRMNFRGKLSYAKYRFLHFLQIK